MNSFENKRSFFILQNRKLENKGGKTMDATTLNTLKNTYDQFVWIPIPRANINDMYMCQSEDAIYRGCIKTKDFNNIFVRIWHFRFEILNVSKLLQK